MHWIFLLNAMVSMIPYSDAACSGTLPLSAGIWKTSNRGTWTVDSAQTTISNFEYTTDASTGPTNINMKCEDDTTDIDGYILLKSTTTRNLYGGLKYIYACIKFQQQTTTSSNAFFFYMSGVESALGNGSYERTILLPTSVTTFDFSRLCNDKATHPDRTHIAIKDGTESSAALQCPSSIVGTYSYSGTSCQTTFLDVCSDRILFNFNYTTCGDSVMFSAGGQFYCVHYGTHAGYNYLSLYNKDIYVDSSTYYRFICMVYTTSNSITSATANPKECFNTSRQTATFTTHTQGESITFENYQDLCYEENTGGNKDNDIIVAMSVVSGILLIAIILIALFCYKYKTKFLKVGVHNTRRAGKNKSTFDKDNISKQRLQSASVSTPEDIKNKAGQNLVGQVKQQPVPPPAILIRKMRAKSSKQRQAGLCFDNIQPE